MVDPADDPVRVCLLVNGTSIEEWQQAVVEEMVDETNAEVSVVLRNRAAHDRTTLELLQRAIELREWTVVSSIQRFISEPPELTGVVDLDDCDFVDDVRYVDCEPDPVDGWKLAIPEEAVAAVTDEADVGLLFGFGVIVGDILDAFEHGILSFHHGDFRKYRGQPAGCWEFIHDEPEVGLTLQRISEQLDAGAVVVEKSVPIHDADTFAEIRGRLWANSTGMLPTAIRRIETGDTDFETIDDLGPIYTFPTGLDAWRFLYREIRGTIRNSSIPLVSGRRSSG